MTTKIGSLAVSLSLDASNFNGSMAQVDRSLRSMGSELKASKALGADYGKSLDGLKSKKDILTRSVETSSIKLTEERKKYDELVNSGKASEAQLERQAKKVNDAQAGYNRLTTELGEVDRALKVQSSSWTQYGEKMEAAGTKMQSVGKGMTDVGNKLSKTVTLPIVAMGTAAFKAAVDFESAFAGVRKTVDMSEAEFATLSKGIRNMAKEIPAAATEIAGVAEAAGQLGIQNNAILGFTRTMVDMGVATNMSSDQAATALARFANITKMNQKDFDRLGSSVVDLGNNFATTEAEIVEMALRLAGAGAQVGMSQADIMGLAAALSSVGIEAEMGGSAMSRVMVRMQVATSTGHTKMQEVMKKSGLTLRELEMMASHSGKAFGNLAEDMGMTKKELTELLNSGGDLDNFAKIAGMTGKEFKQAFEKDAVGALGEFINGLGNAESAGESAINMLQEMGITEIRLRDSLLRAGNASELFARAVDVSNNAWDKNNALTKEAEERYKTTASQIKILWNQIKDLGISMGEVLLPMAQDLMATIKPLVEKFSNMDKETQKNIVKFGLFAAAIGPVLSVTGNLTNTLGGTLLITGKLAKGLGGAGGLTTAAGPAAGAAGGLGASFAALAGPVGIGILAVAGLSLAGYGLYKMLNQTSIPEIDIFGNKVSENTKKAVGGFIELTDVATVQLNQLKWSGVAVSKEMSEEMIETFSAMGAGILMEMKEDHAAQLEAARGYLADAVSLTKEEQAALLKTITDGQLERETSVNNAQKQYSSILKNASDERRQITAQEHEALDRLQREMMETGIHYLSESESEALVILERLKLESGKINAEQAIDTAARAKEAKNAVIEEAEKKYNETIAWALLLKEDGTKESKAMYEKIVADAQKTRDESVAAANAQYDSVIRIAKEKGDAYVSETELRVGRVMTVWEKTSFKVGIDVATMSLKVTRSLKEMAVDGSVSFINLRNGGIKLTGELVRGADLAINKLPGIVTRMITKAAGEAARGAIEFIKVGEDIVEGLKKGMARKAAEVTVESYKLGKSMVNSISKAIGRQSPAKEFIKVAEDAGKGLVVGFKNSHGIVSGASGGLGKSMMQAVSKILTEGTQKNNAEVASINRKATTEAVKIEARAQQDIFLILSNAKKAKRNLTQAELIRIQRLEEDSASKVNKINEKANKDIVKLTSIGGKERLEAVKQFISDKKSAEELSLVDEAIIWKKSVESFKNGSKEKIAAQKEYQKAVDAVNKEIASANKEYAADMQKISDDLKKQTDDLTKAYDDAYSKRKSSLMSFAGTFDTFGVEIKESGYELLNNLQSQVDGFKLWQEKFAKLSSRGINADLVAELSELGVNALPRLIALNQLTDEQLTEYSALYQEKAMLARMQTEAELVGMKEDTELQIEELRETANAKLSQVGADWLVAIQKITKTTSEELKSLKQIGVNAGQGLLNGLASMEPALIAKANAIANAIRSAIQSALDIHSPSRVMRALGVNIGEGLILGMEDSMKAVSRASQMLASAVVQPNLAGFGTVGMTSTQNDNSRHFQPVVNIHTNDSGDKAMERALRRMAYRFRG